VTSQPKLRVAVTAADIIGASALHALLAEQDSLEPVVTLDAPVVDSLSLYDVDVLLWDLGWTSDFGETQASTAILLDGAIDNTPVIALVADVEQATAAWRAGFRSLLLRSESPRALVAALHAAAAGLMTLSSRLAATIPFARRTDSEQDIEQLSDRELQVLSLIADGLTSKAIAHSLEISEHTVKFHVNSIFEKLGASSRTEAVVIATRAGLILL
jgi:DNA-binding NarL/FixJ family response regulator